jgi:hypothetical protein
MKKLKYNWKLVWLVIGIIFFVSCNGNKDQVKPEEVVVDSVRPTINIINPVSYKFHTIGNPFLFEGEFTDDIGLKEVVFSLEDQKPAKAFGVTGIDDDPWKPMDYKVELSGTEQSVNIEIFDTETNGIPGGIYTGLYTLTVTCIDKADNFISESVEIQIYD